MSGTKKRKLDGLIRDQGGEKKIKVERSEYPWSYSSWSYAVQIMYWYIITYM